LAEIGHIIHVRAAFFTYVFTAERQFAKAFLTKRISHFAPQLIAAAITLYTLGEEGLIQTAQYLFKEFFHLIKKVK